MSQQATEMFSAGREGSAMGDQSSANGPREGKPSKSRRQWSDLVEELLEEAHQMPESLGRHVIAGLHGSAEFGMRSRSVGVDDPEEVALRDEAAATAQRYPVGSSPRKFTRT